MFVGQERDAVPYIAGRGDELERVDPRIVPMGQPFGGRGDGRFRDRHAADLRGRRAQDQAALVS